LDYNIVVLPEELKQWRVQHGYSQSQLAESLGVITITISRWERGEREIPSILHLALKSIRKKGGGIRVGRPPFKKSKKRKEVRK
jgi:transcriptional regulator with XRE-family HTH domain